MEISIYCVWHEVQTKLQLIKPDSDNIKWKLQNLRFKKKTVLQFLWILLTTTDFVLQQSLTQVEIQDLQMHPLKYSPLQYHKMSFFLHLLWIIQFQPHSNVHQFLPNITFPRKLIENLLGPIKIIIILFTDIQFY